VFKRFYKGENSVNPKSIGIGLSLAKTIIEEQGGEIKLISEEGKGTSFVISFMNY
jgi:signal transduction histidine kinase